MAQTRRDASDCASAALHVPRIPPRAAQRVPQQRGSAAQRVPQQRGFAAQRGMTLIEIIIVVALVALLSGSLIFGSGMFLGASRRAAATLVVAGVRRGLAEANSSGHPVRLAIDLDGKRLSLERSSSSVAVREVVDEDDLDKVGRGLLEETEAATSRVLEGSAAPPAEFAPIADFGDDPEKPGREMGKRVHIYKVQTQHDEDAITDGIAYIYFWPGGVTERAIVQLGNGPNDDGLTIEVSPLTGRAKVKRGRVDLPESRFGDDEEYSEREEL